MTRDDIARMAKAAGLAPEPFCRWGGYTDDLERFAALVAATEREACAKVCDGLSGRSYEFDMGRLHSAAAIRARGEVKP